MQIKRFYFISAFLLLLSIYSYKCNMQDHVGSNKKYSDLEIAIV